jgi:hypothetical protein
MKTKILILLFLTINLSAFSQSDVLNNNSIKEMVELGFDDEVIISKINSSEVKFDTSLKDLKGLKNAGISSNVLALIIEKSKKEIETGIFFPENDMLVKIEPTIFSGTKSSAFASSLTYGIASAKSKSYIANRSSSNKIKSSAQEFIFQFVAAKISDLGSNDWWFKTASSPNEFVLIKMKDKKRRRELVTGKVNAFTLSTKAGVDDKFTIPFEIEKIKKGRFKIEPKIKLEPGEYCFYYQGTVPGEQFSNKSVFDFSIM